MARYQYNVDTWPTTRHLDYAKYGGNVACDFLKQAVERCRPRLHCFGHIHEVWEAIRCNWDSKSSEPIHTEKQQVIGNRCAQLDIASGGEKPVIFGETTLFVNAAVMNPKYNAENAPWLVIWIFQPHMMKESLGPSDSKHSWSSA